MANNALTLIFVFAGVFMLLMIAYAGLSAKENLDPTDTSVDQVITNGQDEQITGAQKPFLIGLGGFYIIILIVLILGGIGIFIKTIAGRKTR